MTSNLAHVHPPTWVDFPCQVAVTYNYLKERENKMNIKWNNAKKELRQAGIQVNTRIKSCIFGCACEADSDFGDKPTIWQTGKRFSKTGGWLNHENLSDKDKIKIFSILTYYNIAVTWDGSDGGAIFVEYEDESEWV